ncbi:hypothetical protein BGZ83_009800 [Gryganskiella cystojenkinii]|nr:hypothetical protein BGZ83_009800 [Gryganskiella cystojenkinii]
MNPVTIPELLTLVCAKLDKNGLLTGTLVCHSWSQICVPLLWETCYFSAELYREYHAVFDAHGSMIRHLEAKHRLIGGDMRFIAQQCPQLQTLALRRCALTPATIDILCEGSLQIQSLTLDNCPGVKSSIVEKLSRLPRLSSLEISIQRQERGQGDWREEHLIHLLTQCTELRALKIKGPDFSHIHLLRLQSHPTPLQLFHLELISTFMPADALGRLLRKSVCPNLVDMDLSLTLVNDTAIATLTKVCPRLRKLDLTGCSRLTTVGLKEVFERSSALQELKVRGCRRVTIEAFSGEVPWACQRSLESLDMASVGIVAASDELGGLVRQWRSMVRLRLLEVDDQVGAQSLVVKTVKDILGLRMVMFPVRNSSLEP